jgi:NAD(P) transhydrogenase subunit alpha
MDALVAAITVFVLAIFVGVEIITKVPPTLHTPLMSGSNAISGITLIGAVISTRTDNELLATILAVCAVTFAMINVVGGYMVTHRMLDMFKGKR